MNGADDVLWSVDARNMSFPVLGGTLGHTADRLVFAPRARRLLARGRDWSVPLSQVLKVHKIGRGSLPLAGVLRDGRIAIVHTGGTTVFLVEDAAAALNHLRSV